ncbi:MAG: efflux RND transporter periplasmic adaptor subunit [Tepidisphaeraceae bacterium]
MESNEQSPQDLPKFSVATVIVFVVLIAIFFVGLFAFGYMTHKQNLDEINSRAQESADAPPIVNVVAPKPNPQVVQLTLPATVTAMQETALYARVNGYLKRWTHDIQDHVEAGELLAEISAPDLDAQLDQARAALDQAQANEVSAKNNNDLAQATLVRYQGLVPSGSVTQEDLDTRQTNANQAQAAYIAAQASVKSAQANVEQLTAQTGFEKIVAPFAGTITYRPYDVGALISPNDTAAGHELFRVAETDKLRMYVNVPQSFATQIVVGQDADFTCRNYPGEKFTGKVARTAGVLDTSTRTLQTEIDYDNSAGKLFAGMYGEIIFNIQRDKPVYTVPTTALMFEAEGTQLAVVQDDKLHFRKVVVGRDFGTEIEITQGLDGSEQVVANPGERIAEGVAVRVSADNSKPNQTAASTQPSGVAQTDLAAQTPAAGGK